MEIDETESTEKLGDLTVVQGARPATTVGLGTLFCGRELVSLDTITLGLIEAEINEEFRFNPESQ